MLSYILTENGSRTIQQDGYHIIVSKIDLEIAPEAEIDIETGLIINFDPMEFVLIEIDDSFKNILNIMNPIMEIKGQHLILKIKNITNNIVVINKENNMCKFAAMETHQMSKTLADIAAKENEINQQEDSQSSEASDELEILKNASEVIKVDKEDVKTDSEYDIIKPDEFLSSRSSSNTSDEIFQSQQEASQIPILKAELELEPINEPVVDHVIERMAEVELTAVAAPVVNHVDDSVAAPVVNHVDDSVAAPVVAPVVESVAAPVVNHVDDSVAAPVVAPVVESVAEAKAEAKPAPKPKRKYQKKKVVS